MDPIVTTQHAAERSGHWYDRNGNQVEQVMGSKGEMVKPTLHHARKLGLLPGVTTIINAAGTSFGLLKWKLVQSIQLVRSTPIQEHEPDDAYVDRILEGLEALSKKDEGTAVHASIQRSIEGKDYEERHVETVRAVRKQLADFDPFGEWHTEKVRVHRLGFGTRSDLSTDYFLTDLKTKDGDLNWLRQEKTYPNHWMQLAATREAIGDARTRCAILFVSRTDPGAVWPVEVPEDKLERGWLMFQSLLSYWKVLNNYDSGWTP